VFVHGGGVAPGFWQQQVAGLLSDFRTISFDLRGCGASCQLHHF
jgi:pimeloyl-ACP methyl ester carboxylesterase